MKIYFHISREYIDLVKEDHASRSMNNRPKYQVAPQLLFGIYVTSLLPSDAPTFSTKTETQVYCIGNLKTRTLRTHSSTIDAMQS
jgi:hypothetical protein